MTPAADSDEANARVLVVEDERPLADVVAGYLRAEGFAASIAHTGPDAVAAAADHRPDLMVLDLMLPGFDGVEVCRRVRRFSDCYILMLTARDDETDKVVALSVGADDYVVKPFSPRELVARVKAMLRRPRSVVGANPVAAEPPAPLRIADLAVDTVARRVHRGEEEVAVTRLEFDLLAVMAAQPRRAFSRRQLIDEVWGLDWVGDDHLVDVHVAHLRQKLGDDAQSPRYIRTVRGVGYGMVW